MLNVPKNLKEANPMDRHILSQISSEENNKKIESESMAYFDISVRVPCKIGSLDEMASNLRDAVMPIIAEQLSRFMIEADKRIKDSPERKQDGYRVKENGVPRTYTTVVGDISFTRTHYRDASGGYVFLLDKVMEIDSRERVSKGVAAEAVNYAAEMSYQKAIDRVGVNMSRQTVKNRTHSLKEVVVDVPLTRTPVDELHIFMDEDHANVHGKNGKKNVMVPIIAITEGIDMSNPKRHKIKNPLYIAAYKQKTAVTFDQLFAVVDRKYDLSKAKIYIHADGGRWIQEYKKVFPDAIFVMDEFHITKRFKELSSFFGPVTIAALYDCINDNDKNRFYNTFSKAPLKQKLNEKQTRKLNEHLVFFMEQWPGIVNRKVLDVCGSCTESIVSHVYSERLSRTPCAWSERGLDAMAMIRAYRANGCKITKEDINTHIADKYQEQKELKNRREKGYDKYNKYFVKAGEDLEKWFREVYCKNLPDTIIDVTGGVQQFIKRISSQSV